MSITDRTYDALISTHEGLSAEDSAALNRALILLLLDSLDDEETAIALLDTALERRAGGRAKHRNT